ncbi:pentatricopeptide repeat-containing protein At1g06143 [Phoenix dactylifera]|uniref:Pentatricopeptide repeat-containing protein At1g06143 n=1 Tax=Phoenix dactylifera TaxID=42345 RepID=A0A8B7BXF7_PHODC|nr:pentatricopeptide repeat-containing protein At1g06143 [Phoenix dactylifera]
MTVRLRSVIPIFSVKPPLQTPKTLSPSCSNHPIISKLKRCSAPRDLKSIHASMIKTNSHQQTFFMNQFLTTCCRLHEIDYAFLTFTDMAHPNVFVYNAMLGGLVGHSQPIRALRLYVDMSRSHLLPTGYTFSYLIKACMQVPALGLGEAVHGKIWRFGFSSQLLIQTGLVDFYSSLDKIEESKRVFDEMSERDVVSLTVMLLGYARVGDLDSARRLFEEMPQRSIVSWNTMIAGYARAGDVESAASLFNGMPNKDLVSWTTMISCYSRNKHFKEAVETFEGMKSARVSPDEVTMATVISACAHLGALQVGRELHQYALLNGFDHDVYMGSALIDMYAKCGSMERALVVFYKLAEKNLFCWNSVIEGLAVHGHGNEALDMFHRMKKAGRIVPNRVTFVSVLSACAHAGLVEEGRRMFSSMIRDYLISPEMEHYGCMVDLLGRAGLLQEALDLVRNMVVEPNAVIWGALLSGCKIYGNLEIAAAAVEKLMVLEPNNSAHHMLLVNMHAEANRWDEVAIVRGMMKGRGVQKRGPGCSWIEMDGVVHEFAASDKFHPSSNKVCLLLVGLDGQLKLAGYSPELDLNSLL